MRLVGLRFHQLEILKIVPKSGARLVKCVLFSMSRNIDTEVVPPRVVIEVVRVEVIDDESRLRPRGHSGTQKGKQADCDEALHYTPLWGGLFMSFCL